MKKNREVKNPPHTIEKPETRNPNNEESFAFRLQYALKTRKLLAVDLTGPTGIGKSTLSLYINGKSMPSRERILIIADILKVDPAWLLGFTPLTAISRYENDDPYLDEDLEKIKDVWLGLNKEGKKFLKDTATLLFESKKYNRKN